MLGKRRFTEKVTLATPGAGVYVLTRLPVNCRVEAVRAIRTGGTGAVVNAQADADDLLTADLSLTAAGTWMGGSAGLAGSAVTRMLAGDTLKAEVVSVAGAPTALTIQVDLVVDGDVR